ncbi:MAG: peroxiredoxin [Planctomycetota bacterium]
MHRLSTVCLAAIAAVVLSTSIADAKDSGKPLGVGDPAPTFTIDDDSGKPWNSADHFGKKIVVVYFYPADMTGGCTAQACGFRDDMDVLKDQGVEVVGVSGDSVKNHQLFKKAHGLTFTLLADVDGKVADKFGVPKTEGDKIVSKVIDGTAYELKRDITIRRWTFVIDRDGKVAYKNDKVKAKADSKTIQEVIKKL